MIGVTIRNPDGTLTSVALCEICWDEGDEIATTQRAGVWCCQSCAESWDEWHAEDDGDTG